MKLSIPAVVALTIAAPAPVLAASLNCVLTTSCSAQVGCSSTKVSYGLKKMFSIKSQFSTFPAEYGLYR